MQGLVWGRSVKSLYGPSAVASDPHGCPRTINERHGKDQQRTTSQMNGRTSDEHTHTHRYRHPCTPTVIFQHLNNVPTSTNYVFSLLVIGCPMLFEVELLSFIGWHIVCCRLVTCCLLLVVCCLLVAVHLSLRVMWWCLFM